MKMSNIIEDKKKLCEILLMGGMFTGYKVPKYGVVPDGKIVDQTLSLSLS